MSQFPNVTTMPGIDPIGAGFVGNEVNRLQSDTDSKRSAGVAMAGIGQRQDEANQQNALEQQQLRQQQAAFAQQQKMWETDRNDRLSMQAIEAGEAARMAEAQSQLEDARIRAEMEYDTQLLEGGKGLAEQKALFIKQKEQEFLEAKRQHNKAMAAHEMYKSFKTGQFGALPQVLTRLAQLEMTKVASYSGTLDPILAAVQNYMATQSPELRADNKYGAGWGNLTPYGQVKGLLETASDVVKGENPEVMIRKIPLVGDLTADAALAQQKLLGFGEGRSALTNMGWLADPIANTLGISPSQQDVQLLNKVLEGLRDGTPAGLEAAQKGIEHFVNDLKVSPDKFQALGYMLQHLGNNAAINGKGGIINSVVSQQVGPDGQPVKGTASGKNIEAAPEAITQLGRVGDRLLNLKMSGGQQLRGTTPAPTFTRDAEGKWKVTSGMEAEDLKGMLSVLIQDFSDGSLTPNGEVMLQQLRKTNPQAAQEFEDVMKQYLSQMEGTGFKGLNKDMTSSMFEQMVADSLMVADKAKTASEGASQSHELESMAADWALRNEPNKASATAKVRPFKKGVSDTAAAEARRREAEIRRMMGN